MTSDPKERPAAPDTKERPAESGDVTVTVENDDGAPISIRMPVDIRSLTLTFITVVTAIWVLYVGRSLFVPILFGMGLAFVLRPAVDRLERWRLPRAAAAAVLMVMLGALVGYIGYHVSGQAKSLIQELPDAARRVSELRAKTATDSRTMEKLQQAADELTRDEEAKQRQRDPTGAQPVRIVTPPLRVSDLLLTGSFGLASAVAQVVLVCFLVFFILASGDLFKLKLVRLTGPSLSKRKVTVQILDEMGETMSRYLRTVALVCTIVGVATWLAFLALGMPNAALWGVLAAVANTVPYFGPTVVWVSATVVAYMHFETAGMALATGFSSLVITGLEGMLLTPMLMSQAGKMNTPAMFVGLLFWGWLWGFWGMVMAVPLLMTLKVIADRVEDLNPVGELLGE
jgi:predicted PurR-regulated permease PerM